LPAPAPDLPRQAILAFIEEERAAGREPGRRDIAKAFGLDAGGKIWLKRLLRELEDEAHVDAAEDGSPVRKHSALPAVLLCEIKSRHRQGPGLRGKDHSGAALQPISQRQAQGATQPCSSSRGQSNTL